MAGDPDRHRTRHRRRPLRARGALGPEQRRRHRLGRCNRLCAHRSARASTTPPYRKRRPAPTLDAEHVPATKAKITADQDRRPTMFLSAQRRRRQQVRHRPSGGRFGTASVACPIVIADCEFSQAVLEGTRPSTFYLDDPKPQTGCSSLPGGLRLSSSATAARSRSPPAGWLRSRGKPGGDLQKDVPCITNPERPTGAPLHRAVSRSTTPQACCRRPAARAKALPDRGVSPCSSVTGYLVQRQRLPTGSPRARSAADDKDPMASTASAETLRCNIGDYVERHSRADLPRTSASPRSNSCRLGPTCPTARPNHDQKRTSPSCSNKRRIIGIVAAVLLALVGTVSTGGATCSSAKDNAVADEALVDVYVVDEFVPKGARTGDHRCRRSRSSRYPHDSSKTVRSPTSSRLGDEVAAADLQPGDQLLAARLAARDAGRRGGHRQGAGVGACSKQNGPSVVRSRRATWSASTCHSIPSTSRSPARRRHRAVTRRRRDVQAADDSVSWTSRPATVPRRSGRPTGPTKTPNVNKARVPAGPRHRRADDQRPSQYRRWRRRRTMGR